MAGADPQAETMTRHPSIGETERFITLDGLRGVAAVIVLIYHRRFWIPQHAEWHGYLAVDFFFLLSGFVIAHAYERRLASGALAGRAFVIARIVRLYPMIVLGALAGTAVTILEGVSKGWLGLSARAVAAAPFALPQPFLAQPFLPNGPVWSLFFELIANLGFLLFIPRLSTRALGAVALALGIGLALAIRAQGGVSFGWLPATLPLGLLRVGFPFTAGVLLYRLSKAGRLRIPALPVWLLGLALIALLRVPQLSWRAEILYTLAVVFLLFPLLLASAAGDRPRGRWHWLSEWSARLSYPLYIIHAPILAGLDLIPGFARLPVVLRYPGAVLLCIAIALAAERWYDVPVRAWLKRKTAPLAARDQVAQRIQSAVASSDTLNRG